MSAESDAFSFAFAAMSVRAHRANIVHDTKNDPDVPTTTAQRSHWHAKSAAIMMTLSVGRTTNIVRMLGLGFKIPRYAPFNTAMSVTNGNASRVTRRILAKSE